MKNGESLNGTLRSIIKNARGQDQCFDHPDYDVHRSQDQLGPHYPRGLSTLAEVACS